MTIASDHKLLRAEDVARQLNVPVPYVYTAARENRLPGIVRIGRLVRFDAEKLEAWVKAGGEALGPRRQDAEEAPA